MLEKLEVKEWLEFNAKLQQKKNKLRKQLKDKGILKKGGTNDYDNYKYFSEAQYKELFTELFSENGLELKFDEVEYETFEGTERQANGRMPKLEFRLFDIDTGFYEETRITGEGIDKGDKAGYKGYTGALKYYLADTFMVATGDDPEKDSPDNKMNKKTGRKTTNKTTSKTTEEPTKDYKTLLANKIKELGIDLPTYAKEHKLSAKTTQAEAKALLDELEATVNATTGEIMGMAE